MTVRAKAIVGDLRRVNRSVVLRPLFLEGPLNRVDLGQLTGLSSGSITSLTAALLEEGLIAEVGLEPTIVETGERRTNVIARIEGEDRSRDALLIQPTDQPRLALSPDDLLTVDFAGLNAGNGVWGGCGATG